MSCRSAFVFEAPLLYNHLLQSAMAQLSILNGKLVECNGLQAIV